MKSLVFCLMSLVFAACQTKNHEIDVQIIGINEPHDGILSLDGRLFENADENNLINTKHLSPLIFYIIINNKDDREFVLRGLNESKGFVSVTYRFSDGENIFIGDVNYKSGQGSFESFYEIPIYGRDAVLIPVSYRDYWHKELGSFFKEVNNLMVRVLVRVYVENSDNFIDLHSDWYSLDEIHNRRFHKFPATLKMGDDIDEFDSIQIDL